MCGAGTKEGSISALVLTPHHTERPQTYPTIGTLQKNVLWKHRHRTLVRRLYGTISAFGCTFISTVNLSGYIARGSLLHLRPDITFSLLVSGHNYLHASMQTPLVGQHTRRPSRLFSQPYLGSKPDAAHTRGCRHRWECVVFIVTGPVKYNTCKWFLP
jgi:hypothetical protein